MAYTILFLVAVGQAQKHKYMSVVHSPTYYCLEEAFE